MKALALRIVVAFLAVAVVTNTADAQRRRVRRARARAAAGSERPEFGGHVGYSFDAKAAIIGAQASIPVARQVDFYPSFDFYTVGTGTLWGLNFDARIRPPVSYRYGYLGAGLNLLHGSGGGASNTDTNVNLFGGVEGQRGRIRPYAEARLIVGNGSSFQIQGGVNFPLR
jgi:hypothetical protein